MSLSNRHPDDTIYIQNGYRDREEYLHCLADDYGIPEDTVRMLVTAVQDYAQGL